MERYSAEKERAHFNCCAVSYENFYGLNKPAALRKVQRLATEFAGYLTASKASGPVVEIGAGTGFFTRHLAPHMVQRTLIATDVSQGMLTYAKKTVQDASGNMVFQCEDCLHLSFSSGSVACISGHGILHHLPLSDAVKEIARVCKPGGRIAFYEPNILNPYVLLVKTVPFLRLAGDTPQETALNPFLVRNLLKSNGFRKIQVRPCEFVLNGTPEGLVPLCEKISRVLEKIPCINLFGGSLRIMAEKS